MSLASKPSIVTGAQTQIYPKSDLGYIAYIQPWLDVTDVHDGMLSNTLVELAVVAAGSQISMHQDPHRGHLIGELSPRRVS